MCSLLHAEIFARQGKVVSVDRMAPSERHENPALATTVVAARRSAARILCRRGVTKREVFLQPIHYTALYADPLVTMSDKFDTCEPL